ncbi:Ig domain-containing protein [Comamonas sp.]|uniref:Ig domain-containing protein n=1 Tax=Comamonas sp. TaxID=34028 RepID=UPI00289FAA56|nr:Ig domain-containing protein [Comamonas sp.]
MSKKPYTVTMQKLNNWYRTNTQFIVAGLMAASLSVPVSAAPFATTYTGQITRSDFPEIIADQSYTITFVFDNGASSSASQTWSINNLTCTIWRFNDARNVVFTQNLLDSPPSTADGSVNTDATGALTSMFGRVLGSEVDGGKFTTIGLSLSGVKWFANSLNRVLYNFDQSQGVGDLTGGVQMAPNYWSSPEPFGGACDGSVMITSTALPTAVVNQPYTTTLEASGGEMPLEWSASGLPDGLIIDSASGVISGTPTSPGTATVTVVVTDHASRQHATTLNLVVDPLDLTFVGAGPNITLAGGVVAAAYSQPLKVTGGLPPYTFSVTGELPPGLALDTATGIISGTPTTTGTYSFSVMAMDSAVQPTLALKAVHVAEQSFTIVITAAPVPQASVACTPSELTDSANQVSTCTVTLSPAPTQAMSINLVLPAGSPRYSTSCVSPITIAANETTATCTITATENTVAGDGNVTAELSIAPPTVVDAYSVSGSPAQVVIKDDDKPVVAAATPVPTLGGIGLLLLSGLVAGSMGLMRRRKSN